MAREEDLDASEVDRLVGERIRRRRVLLGLTQDQLADALGISYQQIQKYETGANRVSAGRLFKIAATLQTKVGWFFDGLGDTDGSADDPAGSSRHTIELVRGFMKIGDDRLKMAVLSLVRALSGDGGEAEAAVHTLARTNGANGEASDHGPSNPSEVRLD